MPEKKNIYETINTVMADVGVIEKEKRNMQQGFNYRGIDDVMNAISPAFIKNKLFVVPEVLEQSREERTTTKGGNLIYSVCRIKYTFYAEDGSCIEAVVIGEGMDTGDKASNKALAAAFKYACFQVFCIPTEEMKDPDAESHEISPKKLKQNKAKENGTSRLVNNDEANALLRECDRTGKHWNSICKLYNVEKFGDMTVGQYEHCMNRFRNTPDKTIEQLEQFVSENMDNSGLPWNTPER